jgi:hypothetical protein
MRNSCFLLGFIILAIMVMGAGCTRTEPSSGIPQGPQIANVTSAVPSGSSVIQPPVNGPKYQVGDIIWNAPDSYNKVVKADMGVIILSSDPVNQSYTVDHIFRDANTTSWYRVYPDAREGPMSIDDELYPYRIGTTNISTIITKYPSKESFDAHRNAPAQAGT